MSPLSRRWLKIGTATALLFLVFLVGTPFLIKQLAKQWLLEHGGEQVQVQDVDFNPFTATLLIEGCKVRVNNETTLSFDSVDLDIAWRPLFRKQILVQSVHLAGLDITIDDRAEATVVLGGLTFPKAAETQTREEPEQQVSWASGIETLTLNDIHIAILDDKLAADVSIRQLELGGLSQWSPEQATPLSASGEINHAPFKLDGNLAPLAENPDYQLNLSIQRLPLGMFETLAASAAQRLKGQFSYDGAITFRQKGDAFSFGENGSIQLEALDVAMARPGLDIKNGTLSVTGKLDFEQDDSGQKIALDSSIKLSKVNVVDRASTLALFLADQISFDGAMTFRQKGEAFSFSEKGNIQLESLDMAMARPDLDIKNGTLSVIGNLDFEQADAVQKITLASDIKLVDLNVTARESKLELFIAETLNLDKLSIQGLDNISLDSLTSTKAGVGHRADAPQDDAFQYADKLEVSKIALSNRLLSIDTIAYQGGHSNILREANGKLRIVSILEAIKQLAAHPEEEAAVQTRVEPETAQPLDVAITSIRLDEKSKISFSDDSVQPPFRMVLNFKTGLLENLDTRKPDRPSRIDISGITDRHTRISIEGEVKPFLETPGLNLSGKIEGMGLPAISAYTRESLGLIMDSGSLDADIKMASKEKVLDGKADLKIHQLVFKKVESENSLQSKIPVPLNVALDTLRDKNNTIKLEIPITGDASSPDFDISDAISQALAGGVSKGALTYLKFALQPYGTLITAAEYAGEAITRVRLDPVTFAAGQAQLTDSHRDYLAKLAGMMRDRPQLAIKVCGVAEQADKTFYLDLDKQKKKDTKQAPDSAAADYTPQLTALAGQRADAVKDYLVNEHQTQASRLVECQPRVVTDKAEAKPRTDLLI